MIIRLINRFRNKIFLYTLRRKGVQLGANSKIDRSVDILNHERITIGVGSILYKNICLYPSKDGLFFIGNSSHIAPYGYLLIDKNTIRMGDYVAVGPFCTFICHSNHIEGGSHLFMKNYKDGDILIGNNVFIGAQCTILPNTKINDNVVVASNSVVSGELESGWVYGGSPARKIKAVPHAKV